MVVEVPRWTNAKMEVPNPNHISVSKFSPANPKITDNNERNPESHQTGRKKGQNTFRGKLFPAPRVHLELRGTPANLGESGTLGRRHGGQGR